MEQVMQQALRRHDTILAVFIQQACRNFYNSIALTLLLVYSAVQPNPTRCQLGMKMKNFLWRWVTQSTGNSPRFSREKDWRSWWPATLVWEMCRLWGWCLLMCLRWSPGTSGWSDSCTFVDWKISLSVKIWYLMLLCVEDTIPVRAAITDQQNRLGE